MQTYPQQLLTQAKLVWPIYKPIIDQWAVLFIAIGLIIIFSSRYSRDNAKQLLSINIKIMLLALCSCALTVISTTIFILYKYNWSLTPDILTVLHFDLTSSNFVIISIIMEIGIAVFACLIIFKTSFPVKIIGFEIQDIEKLKVISTVVVFSIVSFGVHLFFNKYYPIRVTSSQAKIYEVAVSAGLFYKLWLLIFPPIIEEILFRGIFFRYFQSFLSVRWALIIQAALFAGAHVESAVFFQLFIFGLLFGVAYQRTRLIYVPVILHAIVQAIAIFI